MRLLIGFCLLAVAFGRQGFGPTDQEWGFVDVREGAHMFWWLHFTNATNNATDRPLIIWLQGGPGRSASQYGNFLEIGPWDSNQMPRNSTWVNEANILFVDSPVGTGFSFVDNSTLFAKTDQQIATDFVVLMKAFYKQLPQFEKVPLYIFSESYGGKTAVEIALQLYQANQNGTIKCNIKGVGLGAAWISPVVSILNWAPYLYSLGLLDTQQYKLLDTQAHNLKQLADTGRWADASRQYLQLLAWVQNQTSSTIALFLNVLAINGPGMPVNVGDAANQRLMNELVKPALNLTRNWTSLNIDVFNNVIVDFLKPARHIVERLLNESDVTVAVYNGQLDVFVPIKSTMKWVDRIHFKGSQNWTTATRNPFAVNGVYEGFETKTGNFALYGIRRCGHEVPRDNPNAMLYILQQVTNNFKV